MTLNQKVRRKNNKKEFRKKEGKRWLNQPQIKGIAIKVFTVTPKKPNSAIRKVARIKLNKGIGPGNRKYITAYIPGEKTNLNKHNLVLIRPGRTQDLPGLNYKIIKGVYDCK